jgi:hypothetical protein
MHSARRRVRGIGARHCGGLLVAWPRLGGPGVAPVRSRGAAAGKRTQALNAHLTQARGTKLGLTWRFRARLLTRARLRSLRACGCNYSRLRPARAGARQRAEASSCTCTPAEPQQCSPQPRRLRRSRSRGAAPAACAAAAWRAGACRAAWRAAHIFCAHRRMCCTPQRCAQGARAQGGHLQ